MVKKKPPFPIYSVSEFQGPPSCGEGEGNCDPAENPSHHVSIDLSEEARAVLASAAAYLETIPDARARRIVKRLDVILTFAKED